MGSTMIKGLLLLYVVLAIVSAFERNWGRVLYFAGATLLSGGLLIMK